MDPAGLAYRCKLVEVMEAPFVWAEVEEEADTDKSLQVARERLLDNIFRLENMTFEILTFRFKRIILYSVILWVMFTNYLECIRKVEFEGEPFAEVAVEGLAHNTLKK